jgi:hypothetical protein
MHPALFPEELLPTTGLDPVEGRVMVIGVVVIQ